MKITGGFRVSSPFYFPFYILKTRLKGYPSDPSELHTASDRLTQSSEAHHGPAWARPNIYILRSGFAMSSDTQVPDCLAISRHQEGTRERLFVPLFLKAAVRRGPRGQVARR